MSHPKTSTPQSTEKLGSEKTQIPLDKMVRCKKKD